MIAIRGATTVENDSPDEIKKSVGDLLLKIKARNSLKNTDIIFILFSNTEDLKSYYPAKAAREAGFYSCALFSSLEPDIMGSLQKCIRVMLLVDRDIKPEHVYLNKAAALRKDLSKKLNIAVDGPAGSGKSTVSDIVAKKLNLLHLDTGAMYRACALACEVKGIYETKDIDKFIQDVDINIEYKDGKQLTLLDGVDVSDKIRTPQISLLASKISAVKSVREKMVELQRVIARNNSCILDGRDIGTNVLPNTEFKFYLSASDEVRANRRMLENRQKGINSDISEVLRDIKQRDKQDMEREFAPLRMAADAINIDTGNLSAEEVADLIIKNVQSRI